MTIQAAERVCWKCDKQEDPNNNPENPFVMTAHSETPNEPFVLMHNECRRSLDLLVWSRGA